MNKLYIIPLAALMVGCGQNVAVNVPPTNSSNVKIVDQQVTAKGQAATPIEVKIVDKQTTTKGRTATISEVKIVDQQATAKGAVVEVREEKVWDEQAAAKGVVETDEGTFTQQELADYSDEQAEAQAAQEALLEQAAVPALVTLGTGSFQGASGKSTSGGVTIEEKDGQVMIILDQSFSTSSGPDLYVTLSQQQPFAGGKKVGLDASKTKILGALAKTSGEQVYTVSKADFDKFNYGVTIWCKKYNILFGATPIN